MAYMKNWQEGKIPNEDDVYEIINIHIHLFFRDGLIVYIRDEQNKEYMMNINALKLHKRYEFITEEEMRVE